jgi:hypothetical protein
MLTLIAVPLTCWLCALLAIPRRPLPGNETQELVYGRLLGRQQHLTLLAFLLTIVAAFAIALSASRGVDADLPALRDTNTPQTVVVREVQDDGRSVIVSTSVVPSQSGPRGAPSTVMRTDEQ